METTEAGAKTPPESAMTDEAPNVTMQETPETSMSKARGRKREHPRHGTKESTSSSAMLQVSMTTQKVITKDQLQGHSSTCQQQREYQGPETPGGRNKEATNSMEVEATETIAQEIDNSLTKKMANLRIKGSPTPCVRMTPHSITEETPGHSIKENTTCSAMIPATKVESNVAWKDLVKAHTSTSKQNGEGTSEGKDTPGPSNTETPTSKNITSTEPIAKEIKYSLTEAMGNLRIQESPAPSVRMTPHSRTEETPRNGTKENSRSSAMGPGQKGNSNMVRKDIVEVPTSIPKHQGELRSAGPGAPGPSSKDILTPKYMTSEHISKEIENTLMQEMANLKIHEDPKAGERMNPPSGTKESPGHGAMVDNTSTAMLPTPSRISKEIKEHMIQVDSSTSKDQGQFRSHGLKYPGPSTKENLTPKYMTSEHISKEIENTLMQEMANLKIHEDPKPGVRMNLPSGTQESPGHGTMVDNTSTAMLPTPSRNSKEIKEHMIQVDSITSKDQGQLRFHGLDYPGPSTKEAPSYKEMETTEPRVKGTQTSTTEVTPNYTIQKILTPTEKKILQSKSKDISRHGTQENTSTIVMLPAQKENSDMAKKDLFEVDSTTSQNQREIRCGDPLVPGPSNKETPRSKSEETMEPRCKETQNPQREESTYLTSQETPTHNIRKTHHSRMEQTPGHGTKENTRSRAMFTASERRLKLSRKHHGRGLSSASQRQRKSRLQSKDARDSSNKETPSSKNMETEEPIAKKTRNSITKETPIPQIQGILPPRTRKPPHYRTEKTPGLENKNAVDPSVKLPAPKGKWKLARKQHEPVESTTSHHQVEFKSKGPGSPCPSTKLTPKSKKMENNENGAQKTQESMTEETPNVTTRENLTLSVRKTAHASTEETPKQSTRENTSPSAMLQVSKRRSKEIRKHHMHESSSISPQQKGFRSQSSEPPLPCTKEVSGSRVKGVPDSSMKTPDLKTSEHPGPMKIETPHLETQENANHQIKETSDPRAPDNPSPTTMERVLKETRQDEEEEKFIGLAWFENQQSKTSEHSSEESDEESIAQACVDHQEFQQAEQRPEENEENFIGLAWFDNQESQKSESSPEESDEEFIGLACFEHQKCQTSEQKLEENEDDFIGLAWFDNQETQKSKYSPEVSDKEFTGLASKGRCKGTRKHQVREHSCTSKPQRELRSPGPESPGPSTNVTPRSRARESAELRAKQTQSTVTEVSLNLTLQETQKPDVRNIPHARPEETRQGTKENTTSSAMPRVSRGILIVTRKHQRQADSSTSQNQKQVSSQGQIAPDPRNKDTSSSQIMNITEPASKKARNSMTKVTPNPNIQETLSPRSRKTPHSHTGETQGHSNKNKGDASSMLPTPKGSCNMERKPIVMVHSSPSQHQTEFRAQGSESPLSSNKEISGFRLKGVPDSSMKSPDFKTSEHPGSMKIETPHLETQENANHQIKEISDPRAPDNSSPTTMERVLKETHQDEEEEMFIGLAWFENQQSKTSEHSSEESDEESIAQACVDHQEFQQAEQRPEENEENFIGLAWFDNQESQKSESSPEETDEDFIGLECFDKQKFKKSESSPEENEDDSTELEWFDALENLINQPGLEDGEEIDGLIWFDAPEYRVTEQKLGFRTLTPSVLEENQFCCLACQDVCGKYRALDTEEEWQSDEEIPGPSTDQSGLASSPSAQGEVEISPSTQGVSKSYPSEQGGLQNSSTSERTLGSCPPEQEDKKPTVSNQEDLNQSSSIKAYHKFTNFNHRCQRYIDLDGGLSSPSYDPVWFAPSPTQAWIRPSTSVKRGSKSSLNTQKRVNPVRSVPLRYRCVPSIKGTIWIKRIAKRNSRPFPPPQDVCINSSSFSYIRD